MKRIFLGCLVLYAVFPLLLEMDATEVVSAMSTGDNLQSFDVLPIQPENGTGIVPVHVMLAVLPRVPQVGNQEEHVTP